MSATIDFAEVVQGSNLRSLVESALGPPEKVVGGKPHWRCPFHADHDPSMYLWDDGRRFWCWPCGIRGGDAIDFLCRLEGISPLEAARKIAGNHEPAPRTTPASRRSTPTRPPAWEDPDWQEAVDMVVCQAERNLWGQSGREALDWLLGRGLTTSTLRRFRVGFMPGDVRTTPLACLDGSGLYVPRGVTFPWLRAGSWYAAEADPDGADPGARWIGLNVRRLSPDVHQPWTGGDKCLCVKGSTRGGLYPWPDVAVGVPILLCEGEIDALTAYQEFGWVVNVGTVGGAGQHPSATATGALGNCPAWLLAFDHDDSGNQAVRKWLQWGRSRSKRVRLPEGKDINAYRQASGDLLAWIRSELHRLGMPA